MPAPEPGPLTAIRTFGCTFINCSAHIKVSGVTVLEPIILIEPDSSSLGDVGADSAQPMTVTVNPIIIIIKVNGNQHVCIRLVFDFND